MARAYQNTTARSLDVNSEENLNSLIRDTELVVRCVCMCVCVCMVCKYLRGLVIFGSS